MAFRAKDSAVFHLQPKSLPDCDNEDAPSIVTGRSARSAALPDAASFAIVGSPALPSLLNASSQCRRVVRRVKFKLTSF